MRPPALDDLVRMRAMASTGFVLPKLRWQCHMPDSWKPATWTYECAQLRTANVGALPERILHHIQRYR